VPAFLSCPELPQLEHKQAIMHSVADIDKNFFIRC